MTSFGQSTNYSDSLKVVEEFVKNAGAIQDSLTELKFARFREANHLKRIQNCEQVRISLKNQLDTTITDLNAVSGKWNQVKDKFKVKKNGKVTERGKPGKWLKDIGKVGLGMILGLIII